ncbi:HNH endonuclease [Mycobacterium phage BirdsNest]|uniref:HNH endonuclease n=1 Tax=Mycobacterium phage BirdsNest TaxID=2686231 RepID=A0A6B9LD89_9CAUD|nr:HNH endonuclease [Mycobacterium phage BirdsNest]QHB37391.1 HNH endonuclease [Mycobacterium phage BirdsNest]
MGLSRSITGNDKRGSSYDRRARREWLVSTAAPWGGDGEKVPCWECGAMVSTATMCVDRIIPGEEGGTYRRDNIRPHCPTCSHRQGYRRMCELRDDPGSIHFDPYGPDDHCRSCRAHYLDKHPLTCEYYELLQSA